MQTASTQTRSTRGQTREEPGEKRAERGTGFVLSWSALSAVGFAIGTLALFMGGWTVVDVLTGDAESILDSGAGFSIYLTAAFALGGTLLGTAQWLLLRRQLTGAGRWVAGAALGFAVVAALYLLLYERVPEVLNQLVHNLIGGAVVGAVQAPALRPLLGDVTRGWIGTNALAMLLAGVVSEVGVRVIPGVDHSATQILGIAVAMTLTGAVLARWGVHRIPRRAS